MYAAPLQGFVSYLRTQVGDHLRLAVTYDSDSYDTLYVRDDVAEKYPGRREQIIRDLLLEGVAEPRQEELYSLGTVSGTVRVFEEGITLHFTSGIHSGVLVSLDRDADPPIASFLRGCRKHLP